MPLHSCHSDDISTPHFQWYAVCQCNWRVLSKLTRLLRDLTTKVTSLEVNMRWQKGFSLIELLIVVAMIGVISSIAIPSYITSRRSAREAAAVSNVRGLISAEGAYLSSTGGYTQYASLSQLTSQNLIESTFVNNSGVKDGYLFQITQPDMTSYIITADPQTADASTMRYFYADQSGVIRQNTGATATATSSPVSAGSGS